MAERDIAVKFTGDTSDLDRATDKAERSVTGMGKGMAGGLAGLAGPAAIAGAAIAGVAVVGWDLAQAAAEDEAAMAQLEQQLRQAAGASDEAVAGAEAFVSALSKSAAIADDELRPALATLATATGDTAKAQELLALATDISAGTGKDLGTVTQALAKAQLGSIGGLSKLGIATEAADGKALSLEETLAKARDTFKGAGEAAANTSAGGLKKAAIGFDEFKESIGAKLLPVLGSIGSFINDTVLPAFDKLVAWAEEEWPKIQAAIAPDLEELRAQFAEVFANITTFWNEWGDEITRIATDVVGFYIKYIVTELKIFAAVTGFVIDAVQWWWENYASKAVAIYARIVEGVLWVADKIGVAFAAIGWIIARGIDVFMGLVHMWQAIRDAVARGIDFVVDVVTGLAGRITGAMAGIADLITRPFKAAFNAIADLWNNTIGRLEWTVPEWIPGIGGNRVEVPDIPRFSTFGALTIVMPPGTDGYDIARQVTSFSRNVAPMAGLTVAVR